MGIVLAFLLSIAGAAACAVGAAALAQAHNAPAIVALAGLDLGCAVGVGVFLAMIGLAAFVPSAIRLVRFGIDDY